MIVAKVLLKESSLKMRHHDCSVGLPVTKQLTYVKVFKEFYVRTYSIFMKTNKKTVIKYVIVAKVVVKQGSLKMKHHGCTVGLSVTKQLTYVKVFKEFYERTYSIFMKTNKDTVINYVIRNYCKHSGAKLIIVTKNSI